MTGMGTAPRKLSLFSVVRYAGLPVVLVLEGLHWCEGFQHFGSPRMLVVGQPWQQGYGRAEDGPPAARMPSGLAAAMRLVLKTSLVHLVSKDEHAFTDRRSLLQAMVDRGRVWKD